MMPAISHSRVYFLYVTAQAESESKHLTGLGIARQRKVRGDGIFVAITPFQHISI